MTSQAQPNIDPALYEHLKELAEMAKEVGATLCLAVRNPEYVQASFSLDNKITLTPTLEAGDTSTWLIIEFQASDGEEKEIQVL